MYEPIVLSMAIDGLSPITPRQSHDSRTFDAIQESLGGLNRARSLAETAGTNFAKGDVSPENAVNLLVADNTFKANAVAIRTVDNMQGSLLNTLA